MWSSYKHRWSGVKDIIISGWLMRFLARNRFCITSRQSSSHFSLPPGVLLAAPPADGRVVLGNPSLLNNSILAWLQSPVSASSASLILIAARSRDLTPGQSALPTPTEPGDQHSPASHSSMETALTEHRIYSGK